MPWINEDRPLTEEEMQNNAKLFYPIIRSAGASLNFIAGALGNSQSESTINPGRLQVGTSLPDGGFGLFQWTPASKLIEWCQANGYEYTDGNAQCQRFIWEKDNEEQWIPTSSYPMGFSEAWASTESPEDLASAFLYNYERPADPLATEADRRAQARYWYDYLSGQSCFTTPRLDDSGMMDNPFWYSENPFYQSGFGLPNCTCYCWGRRYEITGVKPDTSLGNADTWFTYAQEHGQLTGQEPKLGAIAVWGYTGSHSADGGHVAIVEVINDDGSIITSNSAYGGAYFYTQTLTPPYEWASYTQLQGFIYLDCEPTPPEPPARKKKKMPLMFYLFP